MVADRVLPLYVSLHTADPRGGYQRTHEARYAGYMRVVMRRTEAEWKVVASGASMAVVNRCEIAFPECTKAPARVGCWVRYFGIGTVARGRGRLLFAGSLGYGVHVGRDCRPLFPPGAIQLVLAGVPEGEARANEGVVSQRTCEHCGGLVVFVGDTCSQCGKGAVGG